MKKLLIGIAVVIVLLIVAAVAVPFFIPVDTYKQQLVARVKQSTGRDLKINGPVSFSVIPNLALEANDVAFSNAPGAATPDMAKFAKLQVQLKLWPLLRRDLEVDKLVLVDPVIALEIDKQGRPNWQFAQAGAAPPPAVPAQRPAQPAPAAQPGAPAGGNLAALRLDDVRLENGKITYADHRSGETLTLDQIGMRVSLPGLDNPLKAEGSAVYRGEKLALAIVVNNPRGFVEGKGSDAALKLDGRPIAFAFQGNASGSTPLKLAGSVDLKIPSIRGFAQWAGTPLNAPGTGFGPLAIAGKISLAGPKIAFTEASLSLDKINGKGEITLETGGVRPALKGRLDVDRLDVNPYLPPEAQAKPAAPGGGTAAGGGAPAQPGTPAAAASGWSDQPIELGALKTADVDFALTAGSLLYRKIQIGKSELGLHVKDGKMEADLSELALYQGNGKGKVVVVDGSGAIPGLDLQLSLAQVQMEPLLKDAIDLDRLSGAGAFELAVSGRGKSEREMIGALNGKGGLNLANGKIKGVDLVAMVKNVAAAFTGAAQNETSFVSLSGTFTIANGMVHNNDLQLKSAELPMTGAGVIDLPHRSVDYKVTPKVVGVVAVPVIIKGPWDHLSYEPDLAGIVGDPAKLLQQPGKLLQGGPNGVGNTLKSAPNDVGNVLKGILGGKRQ
jgi:AsmA protein